MKPFKAFPGYYKEKIQYILTDIDDTLTVNGRLPSAALAAMEHLKDKGFCTVPITGRPAGWCDHIARMWPVDAVVGENGAFYFSYDRQQKKMRRRYWKSETERKEDRKKLEVIKHNILSKIPGCRVSADQAYREADLAIDFCEDVPPLPTEDIEKIVRCFEEAGAQAKISSIHVNGWFGSYNKLAMTQILFDELFKINLKDIKEEVIFAGDSPNDAPMFAFFPHSVGMANILHFKGKISTEPAWITKKKGGYGFSEMVETLLSLDIVK